MHHIPHSVKQKLSTAWSSHRPSHPPSLILSYEVRRHLAEKKWAVQPQWLVNTLDADRGQCWISAKAHLYSLRRPPKPYHWPFSTLWHQVNNEHKQLKQLPMKHMPSGQSSLLLHHHLDITKGFIIIVNHYSLTVLFCRRPHPLASCFRRLSEIQRGLRGGLSHSVQNQTDLERKLRVFVIYAGEFSKWPFATFEWKPSAAFICSCLIRDDCLAWWWI